jgi:hypothetical protein
MNEPQSPSRRGPAIALAIVAVLLVAGILLQRYLRSSGQMEDCLMSGRTNCAPIAATGK